MAFGKSEQERLVDCFIYLTKLNVANNKLQLLIDWVHDDGPYSPASTSEALSLGFGLFNRHGTTKDVRDAMRALILVRLAVDTPSQSALASTVESWKNSYQRKTERELRDLIATYMARLSGPVQIAPAPVPNADRKSYGIKQGALVQGLNNLKPAALKVAAAKPPVAPGATASAKTKKSYYETISRTHVILSGHGSWGEQAHGTPWPFVTLGAQQQIRFYCDHYWPLGNVAGQFVDNRRFPAAREKLGPGEQVWDYTLHPKDTLVLLNKGGGNFDQHFITVDKNTKLSAIINEPRYTAATFHWAACRVVFNTAGGVWCPAHADYEDFGAACVLR